MGTILYVDAFSGASGDMILGALLDLGGPFDMALLARGIEGVFPSGPRFELRAETVRRGPIRANRFQVVQGPGAEEPERHLAEILALITRSPISERAKEMASRVFRRLADAEARVHGCSPADVHFHEVGAVDSIVDIVGAAIGLDALGIDRIAVSPIALGRGLAECRHGRIPIPAPATIELLKGVPVEPGASEHELTTPTGGAILATLGTEFGRFPPMRIERIGYGAGSDRQAPLPNVLRVWMGREDPDSDGEVMVLLETNVDDMSPEWTGFLTERLLEAGAADVFVTPIYMKKSRPGLKVEVLVRPDLAQAGEEILFAESTTFGVRRTEVIRTILDRRVETVSTPWGDVRVKVGARRGKEVSASPEFDDVRRAAVESGLPLKEIHRTVMERYHRAP